MYPILILSGGFGTRLGKITKKIPKALVEINNKPFIQLQLDLLEKNGFVDVILCLGHFSEKIIKFIENNYVGNLNIKFSLDGKYQIGTGGAIKKGSTNYETPFFVLYGDSYLDVNYKDISSSFYQDSGPLMTILHNQNLYDKSNVFLKNGFYFYKKKNPPKSSQFIDYGLSIFFKKHFETFEGCFDLSEVQSYFSQKQQLQFYEVKKRFFEIGSLSGIDELSKHLDK